MTVEPVNPGPLVINGESLIALQLVVAVAGDNDGAIGEFYVGDDRPDWQGYAAWLVRASNEYREWQPIETARHDEGVTIIVGRGGGRLKETYSATAKWDSTFEQFQPEWGAFKLEPTHWMPMPEPPEGAYGRQGRRQEKRNDPS